MLKGEIKLVDSRTLEGTVVSNKMDKTIVVSVVRTYKHPLIGKIVKRSKKYKAHDESGQANVGDFVELKECRPISKDKHMTLSKVIRKSQV